MTKPAGTAEKKAIDKQLDKALEDTFPASDPYSVGDATNKPLGDVDRQPAPINHAEADRLARELAEKIAKGKVTPREQQSDTGERQSGGSRGEPA